MTKRKAASPVAALKNRKYITPCHHQHPFLFLEPIEWTSVVYVCNLHLMMSLFPIIPWQVPVPSEKSLPTLRPCQSNLSNLPKGQRPGKGSSCIPFNIHSIYARMKSPTIPKCSGFNPIFRSSDVVETLMLKLGAENEIFSHVEKKSRHTQHKNTT